MGRRLCYGVYPSMILETTRNISVIYVEKRRVRRVRSGDPEQKYECRRVSESITASYVTGTTDGRSVGPTLITRHFTKFQ